MQDIFFQLFTFTNRVYIGKMFNDDKSAYFIYLPELSHQWHGVRTVHSLRLYHCFFSPKKTELVLKTPAGYIDNTCFYVDLDKGEVFPACLILGAETFERLAVSVHHTPPLPLSLIESIKAGRFYSSAEIHGPYVFDPVHPVGNNVVRIEDIFGRANGDIKDPALYERMTDSQFGNLARGWQSHWEEPLPLLPCQKKFRRQPPPPTAPQT